MRMFNGFSHAILFFNTVEGANKTGINAMMKLCFGSDEDAISQILYRPSTSTSSKLTWTLPNRNNGDASYSIFGGNVGEEILGIVGRASDWFKQYYKVEDGLRAGRTWRVTRNGIQEIKQETATAK